MVIIARDVVDTPPALRADSETRRKAELHLQRFVQATAREQRSTEYVPFDDLIEHDDVIEAARIVFRNRCAVCSTSNDDDLGIARWRPMLGAVDSGGRTSLRHYWWLAYEWANVVLLCSPCSRARGRRFPTTATRARVESTGKALEAEQPLLLDPTQTDYEWAFLHGEDGTILGTDDLSSGTIDVFALNRPELVEARKSQYSRARRIAAELAQAVDLGDDAAAMECLRQGYATSGAHYDVRRQVMHRAVTYRRRQINDLVEPAGMDLAALSDSLPRVTISAVANAQQASGSRSSPEPLNGRWLEPDVDILADVMVPVAITSLEVTDFRGIDRLELPIPGRAGAGDWLMLIGENGVGKTTILQAIALALAGPAARGAWTGSGSALVRRGRPLSRIRVRGGANDQDFLLRLPRSGSPSYTAPHRVAVAAYGAMRLPRQGSARRLSAQAAAVGTLFDPHAYVHGAGQWVGKLDAARRDAIAAAVSSALAAGTTTNVGARFTKAGRLRVETPVGTFPIEELSSGQQVVAALVLDIARTFIASWESLKDAEGVVLIDELEAHLHPRWQLRIVESLRQTFPRLQFVCTTHSPLCLRGLRAGEIRVLRTTKEGAIWADGLVPDVAGMTADQLLTSEIFGLATTVDPALDDAYGEYYSLLANRVRTGSESARLASLQRLLHDRMQFGQTRREAMMLTAIDSYIAEEATVESTSESLALKADTVTRLRSIWEGVLGAQG